MRAAYEFLGQRKQPQRYGKMEKVEVEDEWTLQFAGLVDGTGVYRSASTTSISVTNLDIDARLYFLRYGLLISGSGSQNGHTLAIRSQTQSAARLNSIHLAQHSTFVFSPISAHCDSYYLLFHCTLNTWAIPQQHKRLSRQLAAVGWYSVEKIVFQSGQVEQSTNTDTRRVVCRPCATLSTQIHTHTHRVRPCRAGIFPDKIC